MEPELTIGMVSKRSGVATSALRFYEQEGLITATRTESGQRRYRREVLRRVGFVRIAQEVGLSLEEIRQALHSLPDQRTPNEHDWERLAKQWRPRLREQIAMLERLDERLSRCIGCGCLSLKVCRIVNPDDIASHDGSGPRYVLENCGEDCNGSADL